MSLHSLANHLQSAGRGEDKVLVHMTPGEVGGLQALAMAHGGSLTINPETGLPEAGFLKRMLPMLAGFALAPLTAGTSLAFLGATPLASALTVGGITGLATGDLKQGLMAGLGAYGGAGLGAGLAKTGAAAGAGATGATGAGVTTAGAGASGTGTSLFPSSANTFGNVAKGTGPFPDFIPKDFGPAGLQTAVPKVPLNPNALAFRPDYVAPVAGAGAPISTLGSLGQGVTAAPSMGSNMLSGVKALGQEGGLSNLYDALPTGTLPSIAGSLMLSQKNKAISPKDDPGMIRPYTYERTQNQAAYDMGAPMYSSTPGSSAERNYFTDRYTALTPYRAPGPEYAAEGGLMGYAVGGPVEAMSAMNAVGGNMTYPQARYQTPTYSNPTLQRPVDTPVVTQGYDTPVDPYTGEQKFANGGGIDLRKILGSTGGKGEYSYSYDPSTMQFTQTGTPTPRSGILGMLASITNPQPAVSHGAKVSGGVAPPAMGPAPAMPAQPAYTAPSTPAYQPPEQQLGLTDFYSMMDKNLGQFKGFAAGGGISHLGDYSDGGRLLKGPGDGVSDSIPAVIGNRQPARLADGEFVVPARIVSEIGNGSTEAGARKLYAMMDRVQKARRKTVGKGKVAANTRSDKYLPA